MVRRRLFAIVLTLGVALGGIAGTTTALAGEKPDFSDLKKIKPPRPCEEDPGVNDSEIKIGVLIPSSGPSSTSFAAGREGIEARIAKANAEGEAGDREIVLEFADDGSDPARNLTESQQLVEQEEVFAVIENSPFAFSSARYFNQQGIPIVGWHLGLKEFGIYENMFGWRNSQPPDPGKTFTSRNIDVLKRLGVKRLALLSTDIANSATFIEQIDKAAKLTKSGIKVVYKKTDVPSEQRDFTAEAEAISDANADGLYTGMDFLQNTAVSAALQQAGHKLKAAVFPGGYDSRAVGLPGMEGVYFGLETKPFELNPPAFQEYEKWMTQLGNENIRGQIPYYGWLSADAMVEGIKAAGVSCPTRKAFINNLRLVDDYDANGAFIPVDFSEIFGRIFYCVFYVKVENGAFVPQFDGEPVCAKNLIDGNKVRKLKKSEQAKG